MPDTVDIIRTAFVDLWATVMLFLPRLVFALLVFVLGLILANTLKTAVVRVVRMLKLDELLEKLEVKALFEQTGFKIDIAEILGWIVKWFVIIVALIALADVLGWEQITLFLSQVVGYIPNVLIAVVILLVGLVLGNFVQNVIRSAMDATRLKSGGLLGGVAKWAIIVFSAMAALVQLGIAQALIQTLFTGFVAMIALAGGLAFGLGGREHARKALDHLYSDLGTKE